MKFHIILLFILTASSFVNAQDFEWVKGIGGVGSDRGESVTTDASGNVYTVGIFSGTVDFDPGTGAFNLTSDMGSDDVFIQKLDATGNFLWAKRFGGMYDDRASSINVDSGGNVYTIGAFAGTVDFDPGLGVTSSTSEAMTYDIFILKLDASGDFVWVNTMGGVSYDYGYSLTTDISGNVYAVGLFSETVDFDPGVGVQNLISMSGSSDIFVSKFDIGGNLVWVKQMGGATSDAGNSIAIDNIGNIYTTGNFSGTVDFDPNAGIQNLTSAGGQGIYVQKLDTDGNFIWAKGMGGIDGASGTEITTDDSGNIFTTGYFNGTADFDPGLGVQNLTSSGVQDIFVLKLATNGDFVWAKKNGGTLTDFGTSITTDAAGNIYTTGYFNGTADFDPSSNVQNLISAGGQDIFIQKLNANGDLIWIKQMGGATADHGLAITIDISGNIYTVGRFSGTVDFDPEAGVQNLISAGSFDFFIQKLSTCISTGTDTQTACESYSWIDGNTYTSNNTTATFTLTNSAGCDSLVTLNLTVNSSTSGTDTQTACDSYTWIDGNTYTSNNNTATFTLTNSVGCDSLVTLNLTVNSSTSGTDTQTACDSYTWIDGNTYTSNNNTATFTLTNSVGCDSLVTLNLTVNSSTSGTDTQTACDSYTWIDGNTYTSNNNTATFTLTNSVGCDSLVTLNLTVNSSTSGTDTQTACGDYTWIDGNTYTSSNNTATFTLTNSVGCDSLITLDLTVNSSTSGTDTQTACGDYTWIDGNTYTSSNNTATFTLTNSVGCDSLVTLDLTINSSTSGTDTQTACNSYTWIDGNTYTSNNNTATFTLTNSTGCDSIVTLDLIVNSVDVSVNQSSTTLTSNSTLGTYQWIDCDNNNASITGETNQVFTATSNGDYAVIVTTTTCTDTSECYSVNTIGIEEDEFLSNLIIYPNPTTGLLTLESGEKLNDVTVTIRNVLNKVILRKVINSGQKFEHTIVGQSGVYFVEVISKDGISAYYKVVKK